MFFFRTGNRKIYQRQHGENQRLNNADNDFQKHKGHRQNKGENYGHGGKQNFTGKNVAEQPER